MNDPDTNLYHLYISIPVEFDDGEVIAYRDKSIGTILDDQEFFEIITLQEWLTEQFLDYITWDLAKPLTTEVIDYAFEVFRTLGIKPKNCKYIEGDVNDINK